MTRRFDLRQQYIDGWYELDAGKLVAATALKFEFDDPAEPAPVTRDGLAAYMERWLERAGGQNEWRLTHQARTDRDGLLTDWEWWEVLGTDLAGAALIVTCDEGVLLERITYFDRTLPA